MTSEQETQALGSGKREAAVFPGRRLMAIVLVILCAAAGLTIGWQFPQSRSVALRAPTILKDWLARWGAPAEQFAAQPRPPVQVKVATVRKDDVPIFLTSIGNVQAYNTVNVQSRVDGEITKILFEEGQTVKLDDALAVVDPRPLQAQFDQQQAILQKDQAMLSGAVLDLERYEMLSKTLAVTRQQLEQQRALVDQYKAQIKADEAQLDYALTQLTYTAIRAPLSGRIGIRQVDQGNLVRAGSGSVIAVITQLQPISVIFTVSAAALSETQFVPGPIKAAVTALDQDNATELDHGTIDLVDNVVDPATGTIKLKASFPNVAQKLWPGNFVNGRITLDVRRDGLTVPAVAVRHGPQGDFVWVVRPDHTAGFRNIRVRQIVNGRALIERGLARGEQVIVEGYFRLENGSRIEITEETPPAKKRTSTAAERG